MKLIAKIERVIDNIRYLGIEYDLENLNHGVFLYYLLDKNFQTCQHDDWFLNIEIAKQAAFEGYEVKDDSWEEYKK